MRLQYGKSMKKLQQLIAKRDELRESLGEVLAVTLPPGTNIEYIKKHKERETRITATVLSAEIVDTCRIRIRVKNHLSGKESTISEKHNPSILPAD